MKIKWGQRLGRPECPYARRWVVETRFGTIRLHHFYRSDDARWFHDHPWSFATLVLKGGYTDISPCSRCGIKRERPPLRSDGVRTFCPACGGSGTSEDHLHVGSVRFRGAHHRHTVSTDPGGAWTLVVSGPERRVWGFWVPREGEDVPRFLRREKYFKKYGHHPCDQP